jgi:subtilisin family serine protease
MLKKYHTLFSILIVSVLIACKQDESEDPEAPLVDCVTRTSSFHGQEVEGQYIVSFTKETLASGRTSIVARTLEHYSISESQIKDVIESEQVSNYVLNISKEEAVALKGNANVITVEPDRYLSIKACFAVLEPKLVTWNVDKVGYGDGSTKTAWILDTGIDLDHPDLNVDQTRSRSFNEGETSAEDNNGHGTHIAGIIGAKNNSIGTLGVASGATIVGLKILDENGEGLLSVALKAISYVKSNGKAGDAVNISMGLEDVSEILEREIKALADKGIFVVIAAGNESRPANNFSPARTSGKNIYTITAVDSTNHFASFSNYGNDVVDFAAPGVKILSTYKNGKYAIMSGTSMAAPHVTGLLLINNGELHSEGFAIDDPDGTADPVVHR